MTKQINKKFSAEDLAIGAVFKILRNGKGFVQKEVVGDEISIVHLSNFENGKAMMSASNFLRLLNKINVNMAEFHNAYNQYLQVEAPIVYSDKLSSDFLSHDTTKLYHDLKILEKKISLNSLDKKVRLDYLRVKSILSYLDSKYPLTTTEVTFLEGYFSNLIEWGQSDITLFGQCAQFMDSVHSSQLIQKMLNPTQLNYNLPYIKLAKYRTVLNLIEICTNQERYDEARKLIQYLEDTDIHEYYLFEKIMLVYHKAVFSYQKGNKEAIQIAKECHKIFEFCGSSKIAGIIAEEISNLENLKP